MAYWYCEHELPSSAELEHVWTLWADHSWWPRWNKDIRYAELHGPIAVGTELTIYLKRTFGKGFRFRFTGVEDRRMLADEAALPGAQMGHAHWVEQTADGVTIRNRLYFEGPLARVYGAVMGFRMRRMVRMFVEEERRLAETEVPRALLQSEAWQASPPSSSVA